MSPGGEAVGLIGLGLLGSAMGGRFLAADFPVIGYDVSGDRRVEFACAGGGVAASPEDVAAACSRVVLSLPNSEIGAAVLEQITPVLRPGAIVIDTTTGDPDQVAGFGARLAECGFAYLDATVGGSSRQTQNGEVIVMAGGEADAYRDCLDLFGSFARQSFHVGPCGHGARMKLVVNLVLGLNRAVLAEGLSFARAFSLDAAQALEILKAGPSYSTAMDVKGAKMLHGDFTPEARLSQHLKDVRLILASGERNGARLPLSTLHRALLEQVEAAGLGGADNSAVITAFEPAGNSDITNQRIDP